MKKILLAITALLLAASVGYCENQSLQRFDQGSPLTLTIKSDKQVYKTGQDIWIDGFITNNKNKDFTITPTTILPGSATQSFEIITVNSKQKEEIFRIFCIPEEQRARWEESYLIDSERKIKPNESIKVLHLRLSDYSINLPEDVYTVRWKWKSLEMGNFTSNTITIEVKKKGKK